jgi:DNA-binding NarL/FixJ family response regulator
MEESALGDLKHVLDQLDTGPQESNLWAALPALNRLNEAGYRLEVDRTSSEALGAPLIMMHPRKTAFHSLSPRQRDVAHALQRGLSNAEIANELGISVATVKDHVHAVLSGLGLKRRSQIAALSG